MKPLRVALVVKGSAATYKRSVRNMGYWSYAVPEFTWDHFYLGDPFVESRSRFNDYDLIFIEDGGNYGEFTGDGPPVAYLVIDSTLSDAHYHARLAQAAKSDLILVDHDRLNRFNSSGKPVRRLAYCVNDQVFKPFEKTQDISFHCSSGGSKGHPGADERTQLRQYLHDLAQEHRWTYRSGVLGLLDYAESMGRSRVVVNWPRTPTNRPHRVFDAMASGACVVSGLLPNIAEDKRIASKHLVEFEEFSQLRKLLHELLELGWWEPIARSGRELVMGNHTWSVRAKELRTMLSKELGI